MSAPVLTLVLLAVLKSAVLRLVMLTAMSFFFWRGDRGFISVLFLQNCEVIFKSVGYISGFSPCCPGPASKSSLSSSSALLCSGKSRPRRQVARRKRARHPRDKQP